METKILDTESAVRNINGYMKKSTLNVIFIGRELGKLKDKIDALSGSEKKEAELEYELMFEERLPFGKKVADKFIRISRNKFICRYAHQMPPSYATLYELCSNNISDEMWKVILEQINPGMTSSEVVSLRSTAAYKVNKVVDLVKVEDVLGTPKPITIGLSENNPDLVSFAEDEADPSPSSTEPSEPDVTAEAPVAETFEEDCSQDSKLSPQSDEDQDFTDYFKCLAGNDDDHLITFWDEALTIDDLVQINTSPRATDEEIGFLMDLINEFEDKVNAFLAAKEGDKEAA